MKTMSSADNKDELKYAGLIEDALREFKEIQKELRREKAKTERLRVTSRRRMEETRETLRRVEATF